MPGDRVTTALGAALALAVFSFVASAVLYLQLGISLDTVRPWSIFEYLSDDGLHHSTALWIANAVASATTGTALLALWLAKPKTYFGDARWATLGEMRAAKLFEKEGLLLGRVGGRYLRNNEAGHVLVAAPTRSGKGVGIVIPNLLSWPGSVVVLDIKHENHALTSGFRAQFQPVFKWSPADDDARSHRFNPLDAIRTDVLHRISDLQRLATILLPQPQNTDPMWQNEARDLFLGLSLWILDDPDVPSTLGQIYRTLKSDDDLADVIAGLLDSENSNLDPIARLSLANFLNKAAKERSGVKSNLTAALNLWANPVIDAATSASDFDLEALRRRPTSIYVAVKQNQLLTLAPLLGLFFQQCVDVLGRDLPGPDEPHQVLLLIDEFAALGRMEIIENAMAFLAGYRVRFLNIVQGLGQLDTLYGRGRENLLQNSAVQIFFAANDDTTAQYIAKRLGTQTIRTFSRSDSPAGSTRTSSYAARPLLLSEEVRRLNTEQAILFKEGARPAMGMKIRYYRNRDLKRRVLAPAAVPALVLDALPSKRVGNGTKFDSSDYAANNRLQDVDRLYGPLQTSSEIDHEIDRLVNEDRNTAAVAGLPTLRQLTDSAPER